MKKLIMISLILLAIFLLSESAFAWRGPYRGHGQGHFGFILPPPPVWVSPPAVYYRGYYPPPSYYGPDYSYGYPDRVWVPGHWEQRWTPYGWERAWIPGYWQYGP